MGISWEERKAKEFLKELSYEHLLKRLRHKSVSEKIKDIIALEFVKADLRKGATIVNNLSLIQSELGQIDTETLRRISETLRLGAVQAQSPGAGEVRALDDPNQSGSGTTSHTEQSPDEALGLSTEMPGREETSEDTDSESETDGV